MNPDTPFQILIWCMVVMPIFKWWYKNVYKLWLKQCGVNK